MESVDLERSAARTAKIVARRNLKRKPEMRLSDLDETITTAVVTPKNKRKKSKVKSKVVSNGTQQINVNFTGEDMELNLDRQYGRSIGYCERTEVRIHDPKMNKDDHGSVKDDRLKYVEFQAGLFVAMKKNMIKVLKNMGHELKGMPSVDKFGSNSAEIRICCDILLKVMEVKVTIKIKVHVTKCTMDFQACGGESAMKMKALGNKTGGEYFVEIVLPKVVDDVKKLEDINNLNKYYLVF